MQGTSPNKSVLSILLNQGLGLGFGGFGASYTVFFCIVLIVLVLLTSAFLNSTFGGIPSFSGSSHRFGARESSRPLTMCLCVCRGLRSRKFQPMACVAGIVMVACLATWSLLQHRNHGPSHPASSRLNWTVDCRLPL